MSLPYLQDPDGSIGETVEVLCVTPLVDVSPVGRMRCLDAGTGAVLTDMYSILTGGAGIADPVEYEAVLRDLAGQLVDLHKKTGRAFELAVIARWSNGGGVA